MGLYDNTQSPGSSWWGDSPLADLAAAIAASAGAAGVGYNISSAMGGGGTQKPRFYTAPGTAHFGALSRYTSRLLAENAGALPPTFQEFLQSGGTARFPLQGVGQFTPLEAVQLGLVRKTGEIPYYKTGQGALTPEQLVFLKEQRRRLHRANLLLEQRTKPRGGGGKKKDDVTFTVGVDSFGGKEK